MPSLLSLFRSKVRPKAVPPGNRRTWPQLRHAHSAAEPLNGIPEIEVHSDEGREPHPVARAPNDDTVIHEVEVDTSQDSITQIQDEPDASQVVRSKSLDGSEQSRSRKGSRRVKGFISRFHLSRSRERSSTSSEATGPVVPPPVLSSTEQPQVKTDPVKKDIPSEQPDIERETLEKRNVSAQTVQSQESNQTTATVNRHPSQRIPMPIHELQEELFWSDLLHFNEDAGHAPEPSDPFSDGKNVDTRHQALASSKYSEDQRQSVTSQAISQAGSAHQSSKSSNCRNSAPPVPSVKASRASSMSSHASRGSRLSRVDPSRATVAFNLLSKQLNLPFQISDDDSEGAQVGKKNNTEADELLQRRYSLHPWRHPMANQHGGHPTIHVRPTRSTVALGGAPRHPAPKLRRTKTFANLRFRHVPMSSLRGKTVENLARLGGHSYLILPSDLAPAPLQLPACLVATVMYLRKSTPHPAELFVEPGDIKAATRLYNHFARQVLLAEKDEAKIAMTMRVIAMPHLESESNTPVLSVGWVFKQLLAGLPGGILGSPRLYQVLSAIYLASPSDPALTRLITLAIMALTSEMQCALICAVFGLFTSLLQEAEVHQLQQTSSHQSGTSGRPVANTLNPDGLARVFGPVLISGHDRERATQHDVEQEVEEQRVVGLLLANWRSVSRQLRDWTEYLPGTGKRE